MLKKNCHLAFGSQKSKLTLLELIFQTAGEINPPPSLIGLKDNQIDMVSFIQWQFSDRDQKKTFNMIVFDTV